MGTILIVYSTTAYLFSGLFCYLADLSYANHHLKPAGWQDFPMIPDSSWIVIFWPIWVLIEIYRQQ